jgi:natural product precursor
MKQKKLTLKKITISNLNQDEMYLIRGGFDLEDYATSCSCKCPPPDNTENNC